MKPESNPVPAATIVPDAAARQDAQPWWRHGHVWLIIAGPALVIVAGFVTLWLAIRHPDPVVAEDYYRRGLQINQALERGEVVPGHLAPANKARNHAATGVVPLDR